MVNIEEYNVTQCYHNNVSRDSTIIELDQCDDDTVTVANDQSEVLDHRNITNSTMQVSGSTLLLKTSHSVTIGTIPMTTFTRSNIRIKLSLVEALRICGMGVQ